MSTVSMIADQVIQQAHQKKDINAFIHFDEDYIRQEAARLDGMTPDEKQKLPLFGMPVIIKDNIETGFASTTAGCPYLKTNQPNQNSPVVQRLIDAGALVVGKANLHELAMGITSNNAGFGSVHNPHKQGHIAGGSSGGTAAAIAAGIVKGGLGTDTGGSMRIPAALCGIIGFRPTLGRYPSGGVVPVSSTRDTVGPMATNMRDLIALDMVLTGDETAVQDMPLKGLKLGIASDYFLNNLEPCVEERFNQVLDILQKAGVELVKANIPDLDEINQQVSFPVCLYEVKEELDDYAKDHMGGDIAALVAGTESPDVKGLMESLLGEGAMPAEAYEAAINIHRPKLQAAYRDYFASHDISAILFPTTPLVARPLGQDETVELNGEQVPTFPTYIQNTDPGSNAGIPGISLPAGLDPESQLPIGIELDGPEGSDKQLLSIAAAVEMALKGYFDG